MACPIVQKRAKLRVKRVTTFHQNLTVGAVSLVNRGNSVTTVNKPPPAPTVRLYNQRSATMASSKQVRISYFAGPGVFSSSGPNSAAMNAT
jgi:hypothetical protein